MKHLLIILALAATSSAQTYITVTADTNRVIRTNFSLVRSQVSDLSGATFAISNITGLQTALDAKLATNGSAAGLSNFPASLLTTNSSESLFPTALLRTNGSAVALTNFPTSILQTNSSDGSFPLFLLRTNGSASALTNFPASVLLTNSSTSEFPSFLLRTNGDGSGLTNLPNADLGNATGILPLANGGTGTNSAAGARSALELGTAATNDATAFQPASTNLTALASGDGSSLTNVTITDASTLTNFPSELLRTNGDGSGLSGVAVYPTLSNNAGLVLAVTTNETGVEWIAVSNTVTDASALTNFPASILQTNSADGSFPVFLARTNADASGLTNFPTLNQNTTGTASNVTGVVAIANGGSGASDATNARINLLPSYAGNEGKILAVNSNATDLVWQTDAGGSVDLTNATGVLAISNGGTGASDAQTALTNLTIWQGSTAVAITTATNNATIFSVAIGGGARSVSGANTVVGYDASSDDGSGSGGVSVGRNAVSSNSAVAVGYSTYSAGNGVAIGYNAQANGAGGAVGHNTIANTGGAVGSSAEAIKGFAGGQDAHASATNSSQIGTGTNATDNTIQFLSAGTVDTNEWARIAALSTYPTTNISVVGTNNTNTLVFSNGILVEVQ